jgi:TolB-like protein
MIKHFVRLAGLAGLTGLVLAPSMAMGQTPDTRNTLAVLPFANASIHAELAPLTKGFQALMLHEIASAGRVRVVERDEIQRILQEQQLGASGQLDAATVVRVGKLLGAKYMIKGTYMTDTKRQMTVVITAFDTETSEIIYSDDSAAGKVDDLMKVIATAASTAATKLNLPALPANSPAAREASAKLEQNKKMPVQTAMLYARALEAQDSGNKAEAVDLYKQVLAKFPDFGPADAALKKLQ